MVNSYAQISSGVGAVQAVTRAIWRRSLGLKVAFGGGGSGTKWRTKVVSDIQAVAVRIENVAATAPKERKGKRGRTY